MLNEQKSYYIDKNGEKQSFYISATKNGERIYKPNLYGKEYFDFNQLKGYFENQALLKREMLEYSNKIEKDFSHLKEDFPEIYEKEFQRTIDEALANPSDKISRDRLKKKAFSSYSIDVPIDVTLSYKNKQIEANPRYYADGTKEYIEKNTGRIVTTDTDKDNYFKSLREDEEFQQKQEQIKREIEAEEAKKRDIRAKMLSNAYAFREKALANKLSEEELDAISDDNITQGSYVGGYSGYSRSNSANESERQGSKPMSHWKKEDIMDYLMSSDDLKPFEQDFRKMKTEKLKDLALYEDGWHHTSKYFNRTPFYAINSPRSIIKKLADERNAFERGLRKGFEQGD